VQGVSLHLRAGEVLGLIGENGAGKSTLVRILAGVVAPDRGTIAVDGTPVVLHGPHDAAALGISVIHQELALVASQSIAENLFLGRPRPTRAGAIDWGALRREATAAFADFGHPLDVAKPVAEATVWERWATALVRALMVRSRVLVLDEPTAAMDDAGARDVHRAIRAARDRGTAVVLVSHRLHEVVELCDRVQALRNGAAAGELTGAAIRRELLVELITGAGAPATTPAPLAAAPRSARSGGPPVLAVRDLRSGPHLHDISFSVARGEIVGVAGLVGSGRSRLLRALGGAEPATGGEIAIDGHPVVLRSPRAASRRGVVLLPEDRLTQGLITTLPVSDNINIGGRPTSERFPLAVRHGVARSRAERWIAELGIRSARPAGPVLGLSGGNQQKIMFARALDREPRLLLLDEPTRGVDVGARAELTAVVRALGAAGAAVLVALSDLEELADLVDRAIVLREGRLAGELNGDSLTRQRMLEVCYGER
jgi:ABC-type sugar transport system ATPase subunit